MRTGVALILAGVAASVSAQDIGRLFTTLAERSALNQQRLEAQFARPEVETVQEPVQPEDAGAPQSPMLSTLRIDGVVRRSRGPATVWVNGAHVERGVVSREGLRVEASRRAGAGVQVKLPSGLRSIRLKPGQAIDVATGTLVETFERSPDGPAVGAFALELPAAQEALAGTAAPATKGSSNPMTPKTVAGMTAAERKRALELLLEAGAGAPLSDQGAAQSRSATRGQ